MSRELRHIGTAEDVVEAIELGEKFVAKCGVLSRPRPGLDRPTCSTCVDLAAHEHEETVLKLADTIERLHELEHLIPELQGVELKIREVLSRPGAALESSSSEPESATVNGCGEAPLSTGEVLKTCLECGATWTANVGKCPEDRCGAKGATVTGEIIEISSSIEHDGPQIVKLAVWRS